MYAHTWSALVLAIVILMNSGTRLDAVEFTLDAVANCYNLDEKAINGLSVPGQYDWRVEPPRPSPSLDVLIVSGSGSGLPPIIAMRTGERRQEVAAGVDHLSYFAMDQVLGDNVGALQVYENNQFLPVDTLLNTYDYSDGTAIRFAPQAGSAYRITVVANNAVQGPAGVVITHPMLVASPRAFLLSEGESVVILPLSNDLINFFCVDYELGDNSGSFDVSIELASAPDCDSNGLPDCWELQEAALWTRNPANGHYYRLTSVPGGWPEAEAEAELVGGHLATVRNEAEENWIYDTFQVTSGLFNEVWIGLRQDPNGAEPDGGWEWASGEPTVYVNWCAGEPNNTGEEEEYGELAFSLATPQYFLCWNDDTSTSLPFGLIERSTPPVADCNANGVPDECEIDCDGDGIIDACSDDDDGDGVLDDVDVCPCTRAPGPVDLSGRPVGDVDNDCDVDLADFSLVQENFTGPRQAIVRYYVDATCTNGVRSCTSGDCSVGYPVDTGPAVGKSIAQCGDVVDLAQTNITCVVSLGCTSHVQTCLGGFCTDLGTCSDNIDSAGGVNCD